MPNEYCIRAPRSGSKCERCVRSWYILILNKFYAKVIFHSSGFPSNLIVTYLEFGVGMCIRHNLHGIVHVQIYKQATSIFQVTFKIYEHGVAVLRSNSVLLKNLNVTCAMQVTLDSWHHIRINTFMNIKTPLLQGNTDAKKSGYLCKPSA